MRASNRKKADARGAPATDERVEKSKRVVLKATYELLTREGLSGVSVDAVSRRSGVAKTTIYRHWRSREALLLDACSQLSSPPAAPNTGQLRTDLEDLVTRVARRLEEPWATVMPSIIDAAERNKDLARLQARIHAQMREAFLAVIARAKQRGELGPSQDELELVAVMFGPLFYRRFFSRESLDPAFARKVVARALAVTDQSVERN